MLGNRLGWFIAVLLAAGFALAFNDLAAVNRLTPPTALLTQTAAFDALTIEVPPGAIYKSDLPGDARALYRAAVVAIRGDTAFYSAAETDPDPLSFEKSPVCAALRSAAPLAGDAPDNLLGDPAARAGYEPPDDTLDTLLLAARCLNHAGALRAATDPKKARDFYEAEFALGAKIFAGRVRQGEAVAGLDTLRDAAAGLRDLATRSKESPTADARRAALLATFDRSVQGLLDRRLAPLAGAIATLDGPTIAAHAGDVAALADRRSRERVWRIEAVLALGRHRFNLDRAADRLAVPRRLAEVEAGETDPTVLAAVRAAKGLTIEQYRTIQ